MEGLLKVMDIVNLIPCQFHVIPVTVVQINPGLVGTILCAVLMMSIVKKSGVLTIGNLVAK